MDKEPDICVGIHHELPNGKIVRTHGVGRGKVQWHDNDGNVGSATYQEYMTWIHRPDLKDFPNAKDPLLPYVFDLYWDIKRLSELKRLLANPYFEDLAELKSKIGEYEEVQKMLANKQNKDS